MIFRTCPTRPRRVAPWLLLLAAVLALAGCGVDVNNPPRLATATARAAAPPATEPPPLELPAPTPTPRPDGAPAPEPTALPGDAAAPGDLTVWVNETSPAHRRAMDEMAADFADRYGINVAVQLVSPALLPDLVNTAVISATLPDLILHPIEYTAGWVQQGILDPAAADEVVERLGRDTFDPDALALVAAGGPVAAIPSDGFHQLLLYRADWFDERDLAPPATFDALYAAAEALFDREAIISGLVIPTESNLVTTHQAFEQMALANGCRLIDESGEVVILDPACREALDSYFRTINQFSPPGVQTDTSARNAFLNGRTAIIITSPAVLPDLAGLTPGVTPGCDECDADLGGINYLAANTGILTEIRGPSGSPAAFGNLTVLGITPEADREAAQAFARYWFEEGYPRWLAINPERKVPMRLGAPDDPRAFIDAWGSAALGDSDLSLTDVFGDEVVAQLRDGIAAAPRWGLREGQGPLMTRLYDELTISIVLQEMLSGYFNVDTTLREAYLRTIELIPNYAFPVNVPEEEEAP